MSDTLHELMVRASEQNPDNTAIIAPDATLSYAELHREATFLAHSLIAAGVIPGDRVGLCLPKTSDAIIAVYGILLSGASYVPIDPNAPTERAVQVAANVQISALVTNKDKAAKLGSAISGEIGKLSIVMRDGADFDDISGLMAHEWLRSEVKDFRLPIVTDNALAYILHTSGSTGKPKGVAISHKSALTFVDMAADFFAVRGDDRLCSQAPLHFDLSVFDLYIASRQAAALVLLPEFYSAFPKKYVAAILEHKISIWNSVSSALTLMMENGQPDPESLRSMRVVLFSGEAMPTKYLRMLRENFRNADLYNGYGQTEANTSMYYKVGAIPDGDWSLPIGRAFPQYEVFALDDNGLLVNQPNSEGELFVCSEAVAEGYWGNPELSDTRFMQDPRSMQPGSKVFRTGDNVRINENGEYVFVGRADDMVKSRGHRIELGEIERSILSCPGVDAAACIALPDEKIGNKLIAFASSVVDMDVTATDISEFIRRQLPAYMIPEVIHIEDRLPRTSTGKIDRNLLRNALLPEAP